VVIPGETGLFARGVGPWRARSDTSFPTPRGSGCGTRPGFLHRGSLRGASVDPATKIVALFDALGLSAPDTVVDDAMQERSRPFNTDPGDPRIGHGK
jgi:hypothetical protein